MVVLVPGFVYVAVFEVWWLLPEFVFVLVLALVLASLGPVLVNSCGRQISQPASQQQLSLSAPDFLPTSSQHHESFLSRSCRSCRQTCFCGRLPRAGSSSQLEQSFLSTRKSPY